MTVTFHQGRVVMSSQITHAQSSNIHSLAHTLGICVLISIVKPFLQFTPTTTRYTLSGRIDKVKVARLKDRIQAVAELHRFILCTSRSGGTAHEGGGATSQLDLPSLTPLSVAGCGRLLLGVPHWATSVDH